MNENLSRNKPNAKAGKLKPLKFLGRPQIKMIGAALDAVGPYGEVQLILEKGRLRFVVTKNSHDAPKWHPDLIGGPVTDESPSGKRPQKAR